MEIFEAPELGEAVRATQQKRVEEMPANAPAAVSDAESVLSDF